MVWKLNIHFQNEINYLSLTYTAAKDCPFELVETLINEGAGLNEQDSDGLTALMIGLLISKLINLE